MPTKRPKTKKQRNGKKHATQQSVDAAIWSICDIMRRGNIVPRCYTCPN